MTYRVHYPLVTRDTYRDFATEAEAQTFANERRQPHPYQTIHAWRAVRVEVIEA